MDDFYRYQNRRRRGPKRPDLLAEKILEATNIGVGVLIFDQFSQPSFAFFHVFAVGLLASLIYWYIIYKL